MLQSYTDVAVFLVLGVVFLYIALVAARFLRPHHPYPTKLTTYECGEVPVGEAQVKFNIRFFVFALVFVIFDVETIFLYPWAVVLKDLGLFGFVEMMIFLLILFAGLIYAWKKKVLRWV